MTYNQYEQWRDQPVSLAPELSVIIPTFNEASRVVPTIAAIAACLSQSEREFEIIISDDGSSDGTPKLVRNLGFRNVVVLAAEHNRGKGAAVRAGVSAARGDLILVTDADLSTPIQELDRLLRAAPYGDIVIGTRSCSSGAEDQKSGVRRTLSRGADVATRVCLGLGMHDTQCGFKLFERHAARDLFSMQHIDGFSFDAEVLFIAKRLGYSVVEVPVRWIDAPGSTVCPFRSSVRFAVDLLLIRFAALTGRYSKEAAPRATDPMDTRIRLAVVTAIAPSKATLSEYGEHLVNHLQAVPEVGEVVVLAEASNGTPPSRPQVTIEGCWRFNAWLTPLRILRAVRRHRPDAVLFNAHFASFGSNPISASLGLLTPALLRVFGVPNVVLLHNLVETVDLKKAGVSRGAFVDRILVHGGRAVTHMVLRADRVVTTMPRYVEILRRDYCADNVSLTPHASFETPKRSQVAEHAVPVAGLDEEHRVVLTFGRFGTYKKVELLIEACELVRQHPALRDVHLVIAGSDSPNASGYLQSVQRQVPEEQPVTFTGYVEEQDVAGLFQAADVVVFPYSATTGSSGPLHQAGSYAKAVVAPLLGDFEQLIHDEGFEVETFISGDVLSLTDAIKQVLLDGEARRKMEDANYDAASSLPMSDIAEWHVAHIESLVMSALRSKRLTKS